MKHNSNLAPSRKAWCERSILIFTIAFVIGLCSCGIRPLDRPDNPIVGAETNARPQTEHTTDTDDSVIEIPYDHYKPGFYYSMPPEGAPGNIGTVDITYVWYYGHPQYVEENTVGLYYLQNKKSGLVLSRLAFLHDGETEPPTTMVAVLRELTYDVSQIVRVVKLMDGTYGLTTYQPYPRLEVDVMNNGKFVPLYTYLSCSETYVGWSSPFMYVGRTIEYRHRWLIEEIENGVYRMTTKQQDKASKTLYLTGTTTLVDLGSSTVSAIGNNYDLGFFSKSVAGASDEWLFIPAEPPETTAP